MRDLRIAAVQGIDIFDSPGTAGINQNADSRECSNCGSPQTDYSTVTDLARLRGLSTSVPRCSAV